MIATLLARIRRLVRFVRSTYARWRTIRAFVRKNPHKMRKLSTGGIEVLSLHLDGMPTGRTVAFSPLGIAVEGCRDFELPPTTSLRFQDEQGITDRFLTQNVTKRPSLGFWRPFRRTGESGKRKGDLVVDPVPDACGRQSVTPQKLPTATSSVDFKGDENSSTTPP